MFEHYICLMKIEEAIQQKIPFKSEHRKAAVNLMYTNGWLSEQFKSFFNQFGVTAKQYNILRILMGAGKPVSTSYIRDRLLDRMSDTSRIVDRMCKKELLMKKACSDDRRLIDVSLTKKGKEMLESIGRREDELDEILGQLDNEELIVLNTLLDKLRK